MAALSLKVIGAIGLASYAVAYACTKVRYVSYYRFKIVSVEAHQLPKMPRGYSWRMLSPSELALQAIDVDPAQQRSRYAEGLECLATFDRKGELAGVTWVGKRSHDDPQYGVRYLLPPGAAWDTGLWIAEDKRMTRAFSAVWAAVGEWLAHEGLDRTISSIADYNVASITAHRRLGARKLQTLAVLRLGPVQLTFGARPFVHLRKRPGVPTVDFDLPTGALAG